ncbi:MAG: Histidine biosynthesis bifunctional protein HisB [Gemmatimonadaceae bacterium]|nr:Histidine biosynthesis bifunctional protein HisB [Gemmatimonadaceae bacterium]
MTEPRIAFLDRDGTLIEDRHYLGDPAGVVLLPSVTHAVGRLRDAGVRIVVVTNQSGIARGFITEAAYEATRDRLASLMAQADAQIDLQLHCPHYPPISGTCRCRKPGTELHERAARALGADLAKALYAGDRWRDVEPGIVLGGHPFLVPSTDTPADERARAAQAGILCDSLGLAVARYLDAGQRTPALTTQRRRS